MVTSETREEKFIFYRNPNQKYFKRTFKGILIASLTISILSQLNCAVFEKKGKTVEQIAAERALMSRKTALLERENSVLREENLQIQKNNDLLKAENQKITRENQAQREQLSALLKTKEDTIANLHDKIKILESETGGKLKQLTQLNAALEKRLSEQTSTLQTEISKLKIESAEEKNTLKKEYTENEFKLNKEIQELKQQIADKQKETESLRKEIRDLKQNQLAPSTKP